MRCSRCSPRPSTWTSSTLADACRMLGITGQNETVLSVGTSRHLQLGLNVRWMICVGATMTAGRPVSFSPQKKCDGGYLP